MQRSATWFLVWSSVFYACGEDEKREVIQPTGSARAMGYRSQARLLLLFTAILLPHAALSAPSGQLLRTGQKKCWTPATGNPAPCVGTYSDGEFRKGLKRAYKDNADGTIADLQTGLVWEKLDDSGGLHDKDVVYTWPEALSKVGTLNAPPCFAGHCDWRLPNVVELLSIVDYGNYKLHAPTSFNSSCVPGCDIATCSCTVADRFWSSTSSSSGLLVVELGTLLTIYIPDFYPCHARAVRDSDGQKPLAHLLKTGQRKCWDGDFPTGCAGSSQDGELRKGLKRAYKENGDGTIADVQTGLVWEVLDDAGGPHDKDTLYTWPDAVAKVAGLDSPPCFAGHCDWRIPNVTELHSIIDYRRLGPAVSAPFNHSCAPGCMFDACSCTPHADLWSSTSVASVGVPLSVNFSGGGMGSLFVNGFAAIRAVRGG